MLIREIVEASEGTLYSGSLDDEVQGFTQDTRSIEPGNVYVAIKGTYLDGHDFIPVAFEKGAKAILCERVPEEYANTDKNFIVVDNSVKALGKIAYYARMKANAIVIGITGSVGKTSTKDMIYSVVAMKYKTLKTLGNYNNFIGLPLTILRYRDEEAMVIEMGMNHLNEIDYLTKIACPHIAAITNVGTAHIGELGSRQKILQAKMEIVNGMDENGVLVLNIDNDMLATVKPEGYTLKTIGINNPADLKASNVILNEDMSTFTIDVDGKTHWVRVYVPGKHFVYNALVAIQIGLLLDIPVEDCIEGVAHFELTEKRSDVILLQRSIRLIDGSYNANLDSMKSSIDVIAQHDGRKIAVLGDMLELGKYSERLHREVGRYLLKNKIDVVLTVGEASWAIFDEVIKSRGNARHFDSNDELIDYLNSVIEDGDVILVKGSNGMRLKDVVIALKEAN